MVVAPATEPAYFLEAISKLQHRKGEPTENLLSCWVEKPKIRVQRDHGD